MRRVQYRDPLLVKHILNGTAAYPFVYVTHSPDLFADPENRDDYAVVSTLTEQERSVVLLLSKAVQKPPTVPHSKEDCESRPEIPWSDVDETEDDPDSKVANIDFHTLPGQLVHDWIGFPKECAQGVWEYFSCEGFHGCTELSILGALLRTFHRNGYQIARVFCWRDKSVVWVPTAAHSRVSAACLFCGGTCAEASCFTHTLTDCEGTLRGCCEEHLHRVVEFHDAHCEKHSKDYGAALKDEITQKFVNPEALSKFVLRDPYLSYCSLKECEIRETKRDTFQLCGRCKVAPYCCKEHQVADWKARHKYVCTPK